MSISSMISRVENQKVDMETRLRSLLNLPDIKFDTFKQSIALDIPQEPIAMTTQVIDLYVTAVHWFVIESQE
ncbi:hypothetical protein WT00_23360 [Burkholderia territorii]|nr:hypothetical protein WT00_23360 [Burkholderia territorii]